jgi:hypothetical protein
MQEGRRTRWPRGSVTSRISAIQQPGKPTLLSDGNDPPEAQRALDSSSLIQPLSPAPKANEPAGRAELNARAPRPLWHLGIVEITGHNLEARGREEVNRLLHEGWHLLHIYTLKYSDHGEWCERPMAILGRARAPDERDPGNEAGPAGEAVSENSPIASEQHSTKFPTPHTQGSGRAAGRRTHGRSGFSEEPSE